MNNFNENIIIFKSANIDTEVKFDMNYLSISQEVIHRTNHRLV